MAYTEGVKTYTAYESMEAHRVVVLRSSSTTTPYEVELANSTSKHFLGITVTSAQAGGLVSVRPFDGTGTYDIISAGSFSAGDQVYIYTSNRGSIDNTVTDAYIGTAIDDGVAYEICRVAVDPRVVKINADDVDIEDAGGYYTSDTVEGALQEIGAKTQTPVTVEEFFTMDTTLFCRTGGHPAQQDEHTLITGDANDVGDPQQIIRLMEGSRYGTSYVQLKSLPGETHTLYLTSALRLRHRPYGVTSGVDNLNIQVLHSGSWTSFNFVYKTKATLIGMDDASTESSYSTHTLDTSASKIYADLHTFDLTAVTHDVDVLTLFARIDIENFVGGMNFFGFKVSYTTLPLFQL